MNPERRKFIGDIAKIATGVAVGGGINAAFGYLKEKDPEIFSHTEGQPPVRNSSIQEIVDLKNLFSTYFNLQNIPELKDELDGLLDPQQSDNRSMYTYDWMHKKIVRRLFSSSEQLINYGYQVHLTDNASGTIDRRTILRMDRAHIGQVSMSLTYGNDGRLIPTRNYSSNMFDSTPNLDGARALGEQLFGLDPKNWSLNNAAPYIFTEVIRDNRKSRYYIDSKGRVDVSDSAFRA